MSERVRNATGAKRIICSLTTASIGISTNKKKKRTHIVVRALRIALPIGGPISLGGLIILVLVFVLIVIIIAATPALAAALGLALRLRSEWRASQQSTYKRGR